MESYFKMFLNARVETAVNKTWGTPLHFCNFFYLHFWLLACVYEVPSWKDAMISDEQMLEICF